MANFKGEVVVRNEKLDIFFIYNAINRCALFSIYYIPKLLFHMICPIAVWSEEDIEEVGMVTAT